MLATAVAASICFTLLLAAQAIAQEKTAAEATAGEATAKAGAKKADATAQAGDTKAKAGAKPSAKTAAAETTAKAQEIPFVEGKQVEATQVTAQESGDLVGKKVQTLSTDKDQDIEIFRIPGDCKVVEGDASFVLEDEDGTQGTFINNRNVLIKSPSAKFLRVTKNPPGGNPPSNTIEALTGTKRGGDGVLDTGGLTVVTSTGITCTGETTAPEPNPNLTNPTKPTNPTQPDTITPPTEKQDKDKGPLTGGTAFGKDVLVQKDVIRTLADGTKVYGIDRITISTEKCKLTGSGGGLTITLDNQGEPFRVEDGENVDITIRDDGTIVADGRETLGDKFGGAKNSTRVIQPIPVEAGQTFPEAPNDTFPIVSSTGIGGEGCKVTGQSVADKGDTSDKKDVVPGTTPSGTLADTGGLPLVPAAMTFGVVLIGSGLLLRASLRRER